MAKGTHGFDFDGTAMPMTEAEVKAKIKTLIDDPDSELLAVIVRHGDQLAMPVFCPPSEDVLAALRACVHAVEHSLRALQAAEALDELPKKSMH